MVKAALTALLYPNVLKGQFPETKYQQASKHIVHALCYFFSRWHVSQLCFDVVVKAVLILMPGLYLGVSMLYLLLFFPMLLMQVLAGAIPITNSPSELSFLLKSGGKVHFMIPDSYNSKYSFISITNSS